VTGTDTGAASGQNCTELDFDMVFIQIPTQLTEEEKTLQQKYQKLKRKVTSHCFYLACSGFGFAII
jgi:hypothetical protein